MVVHNVLAHSNAHTLPRPVAYENKFVHVKRVFNTQPEVMGFVICVGETINDRILKRPFMTVLLSLQAGLLLSFGVLMSVQVGGRWGSSTGVNNFVFAGFGIPFGLTFIVMCQGAELITANYMFCTFACLAAEPEDRARQTFMTLQTLALPKLPRVQKSPLKSSRNDDADSYQSFSRFSREPVGSE